jgi:hypothetical protein
VSGLTALRGRSRRLVAAALLVPFAGLLLGLGASISPAAATPSATSSVGAFSKTEKITRANLINGQVQVVDSRTFTLHVAQTQDLRNREEIDVSWTGAHPTGGIVPQETSELASEEEYPVVLMMCRGTAKTVAPDTCWTQTAQERVQSSPEDNFPPYRLDLYASAADRAQDVGVPANPPAACASYISGAQYWVPFVNASGHVYEIGPNGCAGLPPEAAEAQSTEQPGNTTYGVSNLQGDGSDKFVITTADTNASLGCSSTVACSLVAIPIMGISCDPAGDSLPPAERVPPGQQAQALAECDETGAYAAGELAPVGDQNVEDLTVSGQLWWSASNWRNRVVVPLGFVPNSDTCPLVSSSTQVQVWGSYLMLGATQQWEPYFCLNKKLFSLQHVLYPEPEAQNLLQTGSIDAAFQGTNPSTPFTGHVVQAPTAVTGFAIVFDIVNKYGQQTTTVRLDARLIAKLLTESYPSTVDMQDTDTALQNPVTHKPNPENLGDDPEFQALNPGISPVIANLAGVSAATILSTSASSDAMWALTSYINSDPEARAWLNGTPDPWGMVVNPKYKGIKLPVTSWPLLDTFIPPDLQSSDVCESGSDATPWLNLVAEPVDSMATITLDLQFDISDSEVGCNQSYQFPSEEAVGEENPGATFIFGITSLADAEQYGLDTASLETQGGSTSDAQFTTAAGRTFAAPSNASLKAAVAMMQPDDKTGSWTVPYATMRTAAAGKDAYPGTMLISTDVPTHGLPKAMAGDLGKFLNFAVTTGQHPGYAVGNLPPGYLPMTAANGTAKMIAYTKEAAADVAAQNSKVPSPTGGQTGGTPSHKASPSPSTSTSSTEPSSSGTTPASGTSSSSSPSPSPSNQTHTTTPGPTQHVENTALVHSAVSAAVLPLVLVLALIAATVAFAVWQMARPGERK